MIVVKLTGGLGNQMFQYAAARRLADFHKTELKLDITFLEGPQTNYTPRVYELGKYNVSATIATRPEIARLSRHIYNPLAGYLHNFRKMCGFARNLPHYLQERHFHFDPSILSAPDNTYLDGYWQSEKYFCDIGDTLRREFTLKAPQSSPASRLAERITGENAVSIHIRRGDYVHSKVASDAHGLCSMDYYLKCAALMVKKLGNPSFYVFSDDMAWVHESFRLPSQMTLVDTGATPQEELLLMSRCKHHIIANSSFSWWGAWLGTNPDKTVFAPAKWFDKLDANTEDLLPLSWTRVGDP
ncbi:MAG: alpha-1,2-fucosyltransferase [Geobacteraceae bacterium]|nr:alpha-1,2-fucosyltransferase [Geobacteraceae bacterium]